MKIADLMNNPKTKRVWTKAMSNEMGRLAQGNIHNVKYTDTIEFIPKILFRKVEISPMQTSC